MRLIGNARWRAKKRAYFPLERELHVPISKHATCKQISWASPSFALPPSSLRCPAPGHPPQKTA
jgi:hypothetical protein